MTTLLLISNHPQDLAFATLVARSAGYELIHAKTAAEGVKLFISASPKFLFVDGSSSEIYQAFEVQIHEKIGLFSERINPNTIHFISSESMEGAPYLLQSPIFGHLIMRRFDPIEESGNHYGRILKATERDRAFGLEFFLKPGAKIQKLSLVSTDQKQQAAEAVKSYLLQAKFQARMALLIANAVDEILMNAMFDAPVDDTGKQTLVATARAAVFKLEGRATVEMEVGFDGTYFGVTAIDHYGSLDKAKLLSHIAKSYADDQYKLRTNSAGAGIGLASIYRSGGSFFMASEIRERTEVSLFFKRTDSYREFKEQFHFFSTQFYF